ncbi:hypothetical protein SVI_2551 [Shewanella violacea DSS12]|uniref:Uncharacterized protein n=1 Tax=Shewanella violacea (strain JCM 10179 / CIP 106290 / LMG 19151 / DSS12) TaxID=637905 RepID=D4ZLH3_SHEVD|nr:hypothetical protein SVI_2551 [Shewanella violacea DSS12]
MMQSTARQEDQPQLAALYLDLDSLGQINHAY